MRSGAQRGTGQGAGNCELPVTRRFAFHKFAKFVGNVSLDDVSGFWLRKSEEHSKLRVVALLVPVLHRLRLRFLRLLLRLLLLLHVLFRARLGGMCAGMGSGRDENCQTEKDKQRVSDSLFHELSIQTALVDSTPCGSCLRRGNVSSPRRGGATRSVTKLGSPLRGSIQTSHFPRGLRPGLTAKPPLRGWLSPNFVPLQNCSRAFVTAPTQRLKNPKSGSFNDSIGRG